MRTLEEAYAVFQNPYATYSDMQAAQSFIEANEALAPVRGLIAPEEGYTYGDIVPIRTNQATGERELTVPMMAREGAQSLLNVAEGTKTGVVNPEDVMNIMPMGGAASLLDEGIDGGFAAGMFVGRRNERADQKKFVRAEELLEKGETPERIYDETGIYYGRDMKPRQEFSDKDIINKEYLAERINRKASTGEAFNMPLQDLLSNDQEALMMFRNSRGFPTVRFFPDDVATKRIGLRGSYSPQENIVYLNPYQTSFDYADTVEKADVDDVSSYLLHELQHSIQRTDNLTTGTMPENAMRAYNEFAMDVSTSPVVREAERKLAEMDQPRSELREANQADLSKFFQGISISDNASRMAKYVFNDPVYQKNQQEILSELGMPPKKPTHKRNAWLNKAAEILSQKYADSVNTKELLELDRRQLKNLSNRLYRKAYPNDSYDARAAISASDKLQRDASDLFMQRGDTDFKAYQRKLGEQEARAVQDRRNMTQAQLEARFPEMDYSNPSQSYLDSVPTTVQGLLQLTRER